MQLVVMMHKCLIFYSSLITMVAFNFSHLLLKQYIHYTLEHVIICELCLCCSYNVMPKLVNYMAPIISAKEWDDDRK